MENSLLSKHPKLHIIDYCNSLISQIDIQIEKILAEFTQESNLTQKDSNGFEAFKNTYTSDVDNQIVTHGVDTYRDPYSEEFTEFQSHQSVRSIETPCLAHEYFNSIRNEMIEEIRNSQVNCLDHYETIKHEMNSKMNILEAEKKLFAHTFLFIMQIDRFCSGNPERLISNKSLFNLYLFIADFYLDEIERNLFSRLLTRHTDRPLPFSSRLADTANTGTFNSKSLAIYAMEHFTKRFLGHHSTSSSRIIIINKKTLQSAEKIVIDFEDAIFSQIKLDFNNRAPEDCFPFEKLKSLAINGKNYTARSDGKFLTLGHLSQLEYLALKRFELKMGSFDHLVSLRKLTLDQCDFSNVDNQVFQQLKNLEILEISFPKNFDISFIRPLVGLKWLKLWNVNNVKDLQNVLSKELVVLIISFGNQKLNNNLESNFKNFNHSRLTTLILSMGEIDHFDCKWLRGFLNLEHLKLNFQTSVESFNFEFDLFPKLNQLSLRFYQLPDFSNCAIFKKLVNLQSLALLSNKPVDLDAGFLDGLASLEKLRLKFSIPILEPIDLFRDLTNLKDLDLTFTQLVHLNGGIWSHTPNLKYLNLRFNQLKLDQSSFLNLKNLIKLELGFNEITQLDDDIFQHLDSLGTLCLEYNIIDQIGTNTFKGLENLITLNLKGNPIYDIPLNIFENMKRLKLVDLRETFVRNIKEISEVLVNTEIIF